MKAIVIRKKIDDEPTDPRDILESRPLGRMGMPLSFLMGLRTVEMLRNYKRMERSNVMWMLALTYFTLVCLFLFSLITLALSAKDQTTLTVNLAIILFGMFALMLSPYLTFPLQTYVYNHWYQDFKMI